MKKLVIISTLLLTSTFFVNAHQSLGNKVDPKTNFCTVFGIILYQTNVSCYGGTNGDVAIYALGGTKPYSYSWTPTVANSSLLDTIDGAYQMAAGTYTCTI